VWASVLGFPVHAMAAKDPPPQAPATKDKRPDRRLKWTPTPHVEAGLLRLQELGIFGSDRSEIVNHIIGEEMRRLLKSKLLDRKELEATVKLLPTTAADDN
jgi:hypothetical protein